MTTLDWIKHIEHTILRLDEIPLLGQMPDFPWEALSNHLCKTWDWAYCHMSTSHTQWIEGEERLAGLGQNPYSLQIQAAPLDGSLYILLSQGDLADIASTALLEPDELGLEKNYQDALAHFFVADLMTALKEQSPFDQLTWQISDDNALPNEACLMSDIEIAIPSKTVHARLLMTKTMQSSLKEHFNNHVPAKPSMGRLRKLALELQVEVGRTTLPLAEWQGIHLGDFLIVDTCTFDPLDKRGSAILYLNSHPLFRVRLRSESLKIQDYPVEEFDMTEEDENMADEAIELDENPEAKQLDLSGIPITINVLIAQIKTTAEEVMALRPGNVIELNNKTSSTVTLFANGKRIGRGDLIKIGDTLGVRITEL